LEKNDPFSAIDDISGKLYKKFVVTIKIPANSKKISKSNPVIKKEDR